jgi:hypothetical protein
MCHVERSKLIKQLHQALTSLHAAVRAGDRGAAARHALAISSLVDERAVDNHPAVCRRALAARDRVLAGGPVGASEAQPSPQPKPRPLPVPEVGQPHYYTVEFTSGEHAGEHVTFRAKRYRHDSRFAAGKVVLAYLAGPDNEGDYKSCAFVSDAGRVSIWKRFKDGNTKVTRGIRVLTGDPVACVTAYGRRSGRCGLCNRLLTEPESLNRGYGPVCAEKLGRA